MLLITGIGIFYALAAYIALFKPRIAAIIAVKTTKKYYVDECLENEDFQFQRKLGGAIAAIGALAVAIIIGLYLFGTFV